MDFKNVNLGRELRDIALQILLFGLIWSLVVVDLYHYKEDYYKCANAYNHQILDGLNYSINWANVSSNVSPPLAVICQTVSTAQPEPRP
jgi:hypothetical protein